jgi:RNA polymerase-interacting CarD/CdnL/TRCF family regulator
MRFKRKDWLVHPRFGVGRVDKLEMKQVGQGKRQEYYEIAISTGTVWVPVEGYPSGLRKVTPKNELSRYRDLLRSRPTPLAADHKQRHTTLVERLKESTLQARCEVVRDLMAFRWSKSLNESSSMMLRNTRHFICSEWAVADGLSITEATLEIDSLLLEGKAIYGGLA